MLLWLEVADLQRGIHLEDGLARDCCSYTSILLDDGACRPLVQALNWAIRTDFVDLAMVSTWEIHYSSTAPRPNAAGHHGCFLHELPRLLLSLLLLLRQCQYDDFGGESMSSDE